MSSTHKYTNSEMIYELYIDWSIETLISLFVSGAISLPLAHSNGAPNGAGE